MDFLKLYLGIGGLLSLYLAAYYFLNRNNLAKPISEATLLLRMTFYALLWPFCVKTKFSKDIVDFVSISEPLIPDFKKNYEAQLKRKQELWNSPPLCGQQVFARGVNDAEYTRLSSAFIFDAAQLAAILDNVRFSKGESQSDEAAIARWLSYRDRQLNCITEVPTPWERMAYIIQRAVDRGIGEVFCPTCQRCYPASQLVKPLTTFKAGWNFNIINCPENHLLHQTKGMHINMR